MTTVSVAETRFPEPPLRPLVIPDTFDNVPAALVGMAQERLAHSPYAATFITNFAGEDKDLTAEQLGVTQLVRRELDFPQALFVTTTVADTTIGQQNPYGESLGGTRVVGVAAIIDAVIKNGNTDFDWEGLKSSGWQQMPAGARLAIMREAVSLSGELAYDMVRKWLTEFRMMAETRIDGAGDNGARADDWEVLAAAMGGGKSVIVVEDIRAYRRLSREDRDRIFSEGHGPHIQALVGRRHITAVDMDTVTDDMDATITGARVLASFSDDSTRYEPFYVACQSPEEGGTGNPSVTTARGVWASTEAMLPEIYESDILAGQGEGMAFAVQGAGEVGNPLIRFILDKYPKATIYVAEKTRKGIQGVLVIQQQYQDTNIVFVGLQKSAQEVVDESANKPMDFDDSAIYQAEADVFHPCAIQHICSEANLAIMNRRMKLIVPSANDIYPMEDGKPNRRTVEAYETRGIIVVPAPLANLGGILHVSSGYWTTWEGPEMSDQDRDARAQQLVLGNGAFTRKLWARVKEERAKPENTGRVITFEDIYDKMVTETMAAIALANGIDLSPAQDA